MKLDPGDLRLAAVVVSHVPLAALDLTDDRGISYRVEARPGLRRLSVERFRRAVSRPGSVARTHELLRLITGGRLPVAMALHDDPPATRRISDRHWRHTSVCRVVDYFVTANGRDEAMAVAEQSLSSTLTSSHRRLWGRWDADLGMSVVAFEWPATDIEAVSLRVEEALEATEAALRGGDTASRRDTDRSIRPS